MFFQMAIQLIFTAQYFISSSKQSYEVMIRSSFHNVQGGTLKELREKGPVCTNFLGEKWGKKEKRTLIPASSFHLKLLELI